LITSADILKARILIVDDLAANVELLEQMLRGAGYVSIASTRNPHEVCELHRKNHYDLIILDLQMPGLDGFEVMAELKKIETNGYLPVLVITAQPDHKLRALRAGARDFVSKPFDLAEVLMRVHNMAEVRLLHLDETVLSNLRLENSQRIASLGDWEFDFANKRLLWSEEVYRILGISRKDSPPDIDVFDRRVHPEDLPLVHREKKSAAEGIRRVGYGHRIIRPDGEVRHIQQITEMIFDDQGRPARESGTMQDITERKLSETALRESEERYRKLLVLSPDAHVVHVDGVITLVNPAFCELIGVADPEALIGRRWLEMVHPDDQDRARERRSNGVHHPSSIAPAEMKFVRRDGTTVDVEAAFVAYDFHGRTEVQVIARDITARKHAVEEMREKTALLVAQIESSIDGIQIVNPEGKKILQNERYIELMNLPREIADGNDEEKTRHFVLNQVWHPEMVIEKVLHLYAHPDESSRDEIRLKNGKVLDRYSSPILSKEGRNYGRIWTFRDITAKKTAEVALRESEERFRFVARAVSDVIWDWDLQAKTIWWNAGFLTTFGYVADDIVPGIASRTDRIHPDERNRVVESVHHAIATGAEAWSSDYRFLRKDASYAFVQDRGFILRDAAGKGIRMVGGMRDLTEQKKMEAQYLRAQRMESIGTLAGGIAHDLNNVLAPIMLSIELLKLDSGDDPRRNKILDVIRVSSRRGADLVRQVLSFALGLDGQRVAVRLRHLVNDLEAIISETFPRNIKITTQVPNDLWPITGDPTQLNQVLLNLAVNARDAMPDGGSLIFSAANVTFDAQYAGTSPGTKAGTYVLLQVIDTGQGIPPEVRERIFEPFFTTKELGKGTGIGLATVHTVVKSHGGFVVVESEVGRGTTFKIYLPADPVYRTLESDHPFPPDMPRGKGELLLVVDDEFSIREITQQTLEAYGYRVITATDGAEAVALYAKHSDEVALVLTDMMMPIMDGAATMQVLIRINPAIKIIAASGIDSGDNVGKARGAGATDFLIKPYAAETLLTLIREVLDRPVLATVS
jgi:PAS domain S-box-containing protein